MHQETWEEVAAVCDIAWIRSFRIGDPIGAKFNRLHRTPKVHCLILPGKSLATDRIPKLKSYSSMQNVGHETNEVMKMLDEPWGELLTLAT